MAHLLHILFAMFAFLPLFGIVDGEPDAPTPEPAEPVDTLDRATEYVKEHPLFAPEPEKPAEPPKAEEPPKLPEGAKPVEPAKPGEPVPAAAALAYDPTKALEVKDPKEFEQLPYFKDATFQKILGEHKELALQVGGLADVFRGEWRDGTKYKIGTTDELKGVLEDAYSIYDIGNLNMPVESFLQVFEKNYPEANVRAVLASIAAYAEKKGIKAADAPSLNDPNAVRITKMENDRKAEAQERARVAGETAIKEATTKLDEHFTTFFKALGVDVADEQDYLQVMQAKVKSDPVLAKDLREGRYGTLDRVLTEYHNRMVDRQKRWMDAKLKSADMREKTLPKDLKPNQGGSPAGAEPPAKPKVNLADPEARRQEALRQFKQPVS